MTFTQLQIDSLNALRYTEQIQTIKTLSESSQNNIGLWLTIVTILIGIVGIAVPIVFYFIDRKRKEENEEFKIAIKKTVNDEVEEQTKKLNKEFENHIYAIYLTTSNFYSSRLDDLLGKNEYLDFFFSYFHSFYYKVKGNISFSNSMNRLLKGIRLLKTDEALKNIKDNLSKSEYEVLEVYRKISELNNELRQKAIKDKNIIRKNQIVTICNGIDEVINLIDQGDAEKQNKNFNPDSQE